MSLLSWCLETQKLARPPDFVVGGREKDVPYLNRWYVIPRNRWFNIYFHEFLRSDDDRALHDHMYVSLSILLKNGYIEVTKRRKTVRQAGRFSGFKMRLPTTAHRVQLLQSYEFSPKGIKERGELSCYTLFITGPRIRNWGFHCPKGWVPWQEFTATGDGTSDTGKGCD